MDDAAVVRICRSSAMEYADASSKQGRRSCSIEARKWSKWDLTEESGRAAINAKIENPYMYGFVLLSKTSWMLIAFLPIVFTNARGVLESGAPLLQSTE
jgi:hypothetical protein